MHFIGSDQGLAIARGIAWFGHAIRKAGMVVFVAAEGAAGIGKRIEAYKRKHGLQNADLNFYLLPVPID